MKLQLAGLLSQLKKQNILLQIKNFRASDLTWFNSRGTNLTRSTYDSCINMNRKNYKWGVLSRSQHKHINLYPTGGKENVTYFIILLQKDNPVIIQDLLHMR